jgi:spore morphogenesis protein SipL
MSNRCIDFNDIEIFGLCDPENVNFDLTNNNFWTQISIPENLLLPEEKPDIEEINSVNVNVQIIRRKVITTPDSSTSTLNGENREGKKLTGRKLIIEGLLCQTVTYIAANDEQTVNSVQFSIPFSAFIVVPKTIDNEDTKKITFEINTCIEDVFIIDISPRQIFKNVTLLLQAVPVPAEDCINICGCC